MYNRSRMALDAPQSLGIELVLENGESIRAWYYASLPNANGNTSGNFCWYCARVWQVNYRCLNLTLSTMAAWLGSEQARTSKFKGQVQVVIDFVIEKGTRECNLPWSELNSTVLTFIDAVESRFERPDDQFW